MTTTLVLVRHGESEWNQKNLFTGWYDADLTEKGREQAALAGSTMLEAGVGPPSCTRRCRPGPSAPPTWRST